MQDTESSSSNITATSEQEETDWQSHPTTLSLPSRKRKRNANAFREDMLALEKQKLLLIQRRLNESEANEELKQDEDYLFLMSILPAMKKLSAIQKLHLRGKINDWLVEEAMTVKETGFSYTPGQYQHQVGPKYALDDNDYSDDEIVPSAIVEPILLKPDSAEDEEIVLDLKPEPYLDSHPGRTHMEPYSSQDQSWSSGMDPSTSGQPATRKGRCSSPLDEEGVRYESDSSDMSPASDDDPSYYPQDSRSTSESTVIDANSCSSVTHTTIRNSDSDNGVEENCMPIWKPIGPRIARVIFDRHSEVNISTNFDIPSDVYKVFVTQDIFDNMVLETNRYAAQNISEMVGKKRSRLGRWVDTTREEMGKFIGIMLIMGLNQVPELSLYWSKNPLYENKVIKATMPRDRFLSLLSCWHFVDNNAPRQVNDRSYKVHVLVEHLQKNFQSALTPGRGVVIGESMIPWRGRLNFRQYIPNETHKYGVKLYKICTEEGYTFALRIYQGKDDELHGAGHAEAVTMKMCEPLFGQGRILYADSFYTSIPLAHRLLHKNMYLCGTVRPNRAGLPREIVKKKLKRGEICGVENDNGVRIINWMHKRRVLMISTVPGHTDILDETGQTNRKGEAVMKPKALLEYNKIKKGVDLSDQMSSYYSPLRKGVKWWQNVAMELLLGACVLNSWVLHCKKNTSRRRMSLRMFKESIALHLCGYTACATPPSSNKAHTLGNIEGPVRKFRRHCTLCYQRIYSEQGKTAADNKTKRVTTFCNDCPGQPKMCISCFNEKHIQK